MANISSGMLKPSVKVNNHWTKASDYPKLMEFLVSLSYGCEGIIMGDEISFSGRWSIRSSFEKLPNYSDDYSKLQTMMKENAMEQICIYYTDMDEGIGFIDHGEIVITPTDIEILSEAMRIDDLANPYLRKAHAELVIFQKEHQEELKKFNMDYESKEHDLWDNYQRILEEVVDDLKENYFNCCLTLEEMNKPII